MPVRLSYFLLIFSIFVSSCGGGGSAPPPVLPAPIAPIVPITVEASGGGDYTCTLFSNGKVKCWGESGSGVLGIVTTQPAVGDEPGEMGSNLPYINLGTSTVATAIAMGGTHSCALLNDGNIKCWGNNLSGELGLGDTTNRGDNLGEMGDNLPVIDLGLDLTAVAIAAGSIHTCAILNNGGVKCWGSNIRGQLGLGDTINRGDEPGEMGSNLATVDLGTGRTATDISAGEVQTCVILDNSSIKCWGQNSHGELGLGDTLNRGDEAGEMGDDLPSIDLGAGRTVKAVSTRGWNTCALLDDDNVKCWGANGVGQLGQGDTTQIGDDVGEMGDSLLPIVLGTGRTAKAISAGGHTCVLLDNNTVKCWGQNGSGRLGLGDAMRRGDNSGEMGNDLPIVDLGSGRTAKVISSGSENTCALLDDNNVKCWGDNTYGQLGLGDTLSRGDGPNQMGDDLSPVLLQ